MVGFIAGVTAPPGAAWAMRGDISGGKGDAGSKTAAMEAAESLSRRRPRGSKDACREIEVLIQSWSFSREDSP